MSGLAEILLAMGHSVSGSDRRMSEITAYLQKKGAQIFEGHDAKNIQQADYLVYSSAIPQSNPEMERARQLGIPCIRRAEMLGQLFNRRLGIGVAGTHGKTSTTSMLGEALLLAGSDPTIIVGGKIRNWQTGARLGRGEILVAEADEYDRSFLALFPRLAVLTSLEADHLDIYKDLDDLKGTFLRFAGQVAFDGALIVNGDDPVLQELIPQMQAQVITYGLAPERDYHAADLRFEEAFSTFSVYGGERLLGKIKLSVPGEHNIKNALAVVAAGMELEIDFNTLKQSLGSYQGVGRRFEILGSAQNILVVDDYAHHPTEIRATLQSARRGWRRKIIAVFQPHLYSRTRDFYKEFAAALDLADLTLVTDVYPAREEALAGISGELIVKEMASKTLYVEQKEQLLSALRAQARAGDMVIFIGAGDITLFAHQYFETLKED